MLEVLSERWMMAMSFTIEGGMNVETSSTKAIWIVKTISTIASTIILTTTELCLEIHTTLKLLRLFKCRTNPIPVTTTTIIDTLHKITQEEEEAEAEGGGTHSGGGASSNWHQSGHNNYYGRGQSFRGGGGQSGYYNQGGYSSSRYPPHQQYNQQQGYHQQDYHSNIRNAGRGGHQPHYMNQSRPGGGRPHVWINFKEI